MDFESNERWYAELEEFISRWENEAEELKQKKLSTDECTMISKMLQKGEDELLLKRPAGFSDLTVSHKLDDLDKKLNSSLAMALTSQ